MVDHRLDPRGVKPSDTEGDVMTTTGGVAGWGAPPASGVESVTAGTYIEVDATDPAHIIVTAMVPMTTTVGGVPQLVFDDDGHLIYTEAP